MTWSTHDLTSRLNSVSGTKGIFADYPARIFIDGSKAGRWLKPRRLAEPRRVSRSIRAPALEENREMARKLGGHGGMDYVMITGSWIA